MGLTITDGAKLLKNGYTLSDLKELNTVLDKNPDNGNDIVELAKKLSFSDLQSALKLFNLGAHTEKPDNNNADEDDEDAEGDDGENQGKHTPDDDHSEDDNIDYKQKYEEEKSLREKLQRANQNRNIGDDGKPQKTPFEIAQEIANDILN